MEFPAQKSGRSSRRPAYGRYGKMKKISILYHVIIRRFLQGGALLGLERLNLKFDPLYAQKT